MLIMGEVRTGLLQNSAEVPESDLSSVLGLLAGERVRISRRPILHALSPDLLTGVDCLLPSAAQAKIRGVGTVVSRCSITGGRVVQSSSYVRVTKAETGHRLPWSHYLARPGVIEVLGKAAAADLADGFLAFGLPGEHLDVGSISDRLMDTVQAAESLDRASPFRSTQTRLRWVAASGEPGVRFVLGEGVERRVRITYEGEFSTAVLDLCEDLALHDWLLTTLLVIVERARIGAAPRAEVSARLAPAVDALLHLWMPGARIHPSLAPLWESLELAPGFTRQWQSLVERVRDQFAVNTLALLLRETNPV
ncbi:SCO2521 family protein [Acrocarpospora catenulata]|uniref:SCO2521 family protein n=1 Tax=Acrocarpospora catenulata TaxID=2836182 RepID=UPI001BDABBF6|nr:SCO2521 family protein [Acrocarpospora catenulata]